VIGSRNKCTQNFVGQKHHSIKIYADFIRCEVR
jgi:hypothetical protein